MRVALVGGGITGLTAATRLAESGREIILYEASSAGGLAAGFPFPGMEGVWLEKFYHHLFRSDLHIVRFIEELGLGADLIWQTSRSGLFADGRVWPFGTPLELLRCRPIGGLLERLKMGLSLRVFQKTSDWDQFDAMTCEEFFASRSCLRGYRGLWEPLLKAKFGDAYARIPAAFLWGRIYPRSRSREKGVETLGYLRGGFARLMQAMMVRLEERGVLVRLHHEVQRIERLGPRRFRVHTSRGAEDFDRVVWTAPPAQLARILEPPEEMLTRLASRIEYVAACCLILFVKQRLSDFYWINNLDPEVTFGGCIEHTNLVPPEHYGGQRLLYVINYLRPDHPYMRLRSEDLLRLHLPSLARLYPGFDASLVERKFVFRTAVASPLYDLGFRDRIPPFSGWSPGIGMLGMAQVYPMDRNMNHCAEVALRCDLETFLDDATDCSTPPVRRA